MPVPAAGRQGKSGPTAQPPDFDYMTLGKSDGIAIDAIGSNLCATAPLQDISKLRSRCPVGTKDELLGAIAGGKPSRPNHSLARSASVGLRQNRVFLEKNLT
jgi:hypothetical protein